MSCNQYRHVCFKDLENYFKKDNYFGDLSEEEKQIIRENLGVIGVNDSVDVNFTIVKGLYEDIKNLADTDLLVIGNIYMITDFQTIYLCGDEVLGTNDSLYPSDIYTIILFPTSSCTFNKNVILKKLNSCDTASNWDVQYDITSETLGTTKTKGKIIYLRDTNNNSAYYDFKNIRFKRTVDELSIGSTSYTQDTYFRTFDSDGNDASEGTSCKNNHLEKGCTDTIFIGGNTLSNVFKGDSHNNTFFKECLNNTFGYGTSNNYFIVDVQYTRGIVHDRTLGTLTDLSVPKSFDVLDGKQVLIYLDPDTQTLQIVEI